MSRGRVERAAFAGGASGRLGERHYEAPVFGLFVSGGDAVDDLDRLSQGGRRFVPEGVAIVRAVDRVGRRRGEQLAQELGVVGAACVAVGSDCGKCRAHAEPRLSAITHMAARSGAPATTDHCCGVNFVIAVVMGFSLRGTVFVVRCSMAVTVRSGRGGAGARRRPQRQRRPRRSRPGRRARVRAACRG